MSQSVVCVVDDDTLVRDSLAALLRAHLDARVEEFSSGSDFLAAVSPDVACLILDLRMPRMSGWEVLAGLQRRGLEIPTYIISGHLDDLPSDRELPSFVEKFLQKPFDVKELLSGVSALLGDAGGTVL